MKKKVYQNVIILQETIPPTNAEAAAQADGFHFRFPVPTPSFFPHFCFAYSELLFPNRKQMNPKTLSPPSLPAMTLSTRNRKCDSSSRRRRISTHGRANAAPFSPSRRRSSCGGRRETGLTARLLARTFSSTIRTNVTGSFDDSTLIRR